MGERRPRAGNRGRDRNLPALSHHPHRCRYGVAVAVAKRAPTRRARLFTPRPAALPSSASGGGAERGVRERKKLKTRESIQRTALRLFEKQGYEETTIEQIAAAAEISPSTFFNYFPTKEDVVLYDAYAPVAIRMFLERPKDEPLNVGLRKVLQRLAAC